MKYQRLLKRETMEIKDSVILITSAGTILGSTLAVHFSALGAKVIAIDTDLKRLNKTDFICKENVDNILSLSIEDYSIDSIQKLFTELQEEFKISINVLINYWPSKPLPSLISNDNSDYFSEQLSSLASPIFGFGQASVSHMRKNNNQNLIINMTTFPFEQQTLGLEGVTSIVSGFTKSWAKELTPLNIRVGGVIPDISHSIDGHQIERWASIQDELIQSAEYIVSNDSFNGRIMAAGM